MNKILLFLLFIISGADAVAQPAQYAFRIRFKDKQSTTFSPDTPLAYLSARSIARREKYGIAIDSTDLPVSRLYTDSILHITGGILHNTSKWFNQCVILLEDSSAILDAVMPAFVAEVKKVAYYDSGLHERPHGGDTGLKPTDFDEEFYGAAWSQIHLCNGEWLHQQGYMGENMMIAVLDVGFPGVDIVPAFESMRSEGRLADVYNFIYDTEDIYTGDAHGTRVLSCLAAYLPDTYVGTAPQATYLLYATDHASTEQLIEEDNWLAAAERADSMGADLINTSLGYNTFDNPEDSYTYEDLDGVTTLLARAANKAVSKGILVVASAGNEGVTPWEHILTPGDADSALTVGSVNNMKEPAASSGEGPNAAGVLKPNVCTQGVAAATINAAGAVTTGTGTSFATPILSGMAACLMQMAPARTPLQIRNVIEEVSDHFEDPDNKIGHGVPDFHKAFNILGAASVKPALPEIQIRPNPVQNELTITFSASAGDYTWEICDMLGRNYSNGHANGNQLVKSIPTNMLLPGLYLLKITTPRGKLSFKVLKQ